MPTKICFGDSDKQLAHVTDQSDFTADISRPDGLAAYCRVCAASRQRRWKQNNKEKVRAFKRNYRKNQKYNEAH